MCGVGKLANVHVRVNSKLPRTYFGRNFANGAVQALDHVPKATQCTRETSLRVLQHRLCYDGMWGHSQHVASTQVTAPPTIMYGQNVTFLDADGTESTGSRMKLAAVFLLGI